MRQLRALRRVVCFRFETWWHADEVKSAQGLFDRLLAKGLQDLVAQKPISLDVPGQFNHVERQEPFDGGARREFRDDRLSHQLVVFEVLAGEQQRRWRQGTQHRAIASWLGVLFSDLKFPWVGHKWQ
jgi:hypothetical protein